MSVCTSLQTDNHTSTPPLSFYTGWMPFLLPNQQCQNTEGNSTNKQMKNKYKIDNSPTCLQGSFPSPSELLLSSTWLDNIVISSLSYD